MQLQFGPSNHPQHLKTTLTSIPLHLNMHFQYPDDKQRLIDRNFMTLSSPFSRLGYCENGGNEENSCNCKLVSSQSQHTSRQGLVQQASASYSVGSW